MSKRILVVEDEPAIRDGLQNLFVFHGYEVVVCADGESGLQTALAERFELVVLDLMLPLRDGFSVCQEIRRAKPRLPVIMLTAKTSEDDIVNGLKLGADDYMPKPFSLRVLLTRVENLMAREQRGSTSASIKVGPWQISSINLEAIHGVNQTVVELSAREVDILEFLASRGGESKTREELLSEVWGYRDAKDIETRTVDIHMAKLRKKLELNPKEPKLLVTVRGRGYRLVGHDEF